MVPLVYVTGISGAIHLSNYYLEAARHGSLPEAPGKAVAHAAVPLVLAAVTTALGLLSLCYSELNPIRLFGVFSAIGVVIGSLAQFTLLPAALAVWTPLPRQHRRAGEWRRGAANPRSWRCSRNWARGCPRHPTLVAVACLVADAGDRRGPAADPYFDQDDAVVLAPRPGDPHDELAGRETRGHDSVGSALAFLARERDIDVRADPLGGGHRCAAAPPAAGQRQSVSGHVCAPRGHSFPFDTTGGTRGGQRQAEAAVRCAAPVRLGRPGWR